MNYKLVVLEPAEDDVDEIYRFIRKRSVSGAKSWYRAFVDCTERIVRQPLSYAAAPESARFDFALRQAIFKTRYGDPYRSVFTVIDDEVRILRIRGRGQPPLRASEIVTS